MKDIEKLHDDIFVAIKNQNYGFLIELSERMTNKKDTQYLGYLLIAVVALSNEDYDIFKSVLLNCVLAYRTPKASEERQMIEKLLNYRTASSKTILSFILEQNLTTEIKRIYILFVLAQQSNPQETVNINNNDITIFESLNKLGGIDSTTFSIILKNENVNLETLTTENNKLLNMLDFDSHSIIQKSEEELDNLLISELMDEVDNNMTNDQPLYAHMYSIILFVLYPTIDEVEYKKTFTLVYSMLYNHSNRSEDINNDSIKQTIEYIASVSNETARSIKYIVESKLISSHMLKKIISLLIDSSLQFKPDKNFERRLSYFYQALFENIDLEASSLHTTILKKIKPKLITILNKRLNSHLPLYFRPMWEDLTRLDTTLPACDDVYVMYELLIQKQRVEQILECNVSQINETYFTKITDSNLLPSLRSINELVNKYGQYIEHIYNENFADELKSFNENASTLFKDYKTYLEDQKAKKRRHRKRMKRLVIVFVPTIIIVTVAILFTVGHVTRQNAYDLAGEPLSSFLIDNDLENGYNIEEAFVTNQDTLKVYVHVSHFAGDFYVELSNQEGYTYNQVNEQRFSELRQDTIITYFLEPNLSNSSIAQSIILED